MIEALLAHVGKPFVGIYRQIEELGRFCIFHIRLLPMYVSPPFRTNLVFRQMESIGVNSLGVVLMIALFSGMVLAVQLYAAFDEFSAENMIGYTIFFAVGKELGPVFTALMVISRAVSAMAAELGTMRVTEQIDAIEVLSIDSKQYLIVPRVLATMLMMPFLVVLFDLMANIAAYMLSVYALDVNATAYMNMISQFSKLSDFATGLIKGVVFGLVISAIGTYVGFFTSGGARGVGLATTKAVVVSSVALFLTNYFLSSLFLILDW